MDIENVSNRFEKNLKVQHYAIELSKDWMPNDYDSVVDEKILKIDFQPDVFQKQAFYFLAKNESVFVSAHTSSGKTLVAEYAIAKAELYGNRVIYTSPIKALSNQKFYDFKQKFSDVGLITGDVQVNPEAKCLIMTTEILRNFVYKNADILRDTEFVVFDEVHYINDAERGVVWEECIIMLPKHISLVMLSATIPNSFEFSEWVGRTKERCVHVISTLKRAVPLEFAIYCDSEVYKLDDLPARMNQPDNSVSNFKEVLQPFSKKLKIYNRFRINDLGNFIKYKNLLPAIFFTLSRKSCEEFGRSLQNLDLTTPEEKVSIENFLNDALSNLKEDEKYLPQIKVMRMQVYRGIGVHHGTLLPFVKECVEILFSENLIKILVATETFAMGVNMPAKCCVFLSLTKIDNGVFRNLTTGEFIQMSGRAGRRGMDKVGTVIIADPKITSSATIKKIVSGSQNNMSSKFKLSYSLILMALRSNVEVKDLMRNSFRENGSQKFYSSDMVRLAALENEKTLCCKKCHDYLDFFNELDFINKKVSSIVKNIVKVGSICILRNNAVVKIVSISQNNLKCVNYEEDLKESMFSLPLNSEIIERYEKNSSKVFFKYPPNYRYKFDGIASFEDVVFVVKNNAISFEFDEIPIQFISEISEIKLSFEKIKKLSFLHCENIEKHYIEAIKSRNICEEMNNIKNKYAISSLKQMNEYINRLKFLTHYEFFDEKITLKGRAAAEIRTVNEVLTIELIMNNEFDNFDPSELMAVLSTMILEVTVEEYVVDELLKQKLEIIENYYKKMNDNSYKFQIADFLPLNFSCVQAVYDWCKGNPLETIIYKHRIPEGSFVRLILRLDECCRELLNVAVLISDQKLEEKINSAIFCIRRDIIFLPSLYI